ncbi:MAG: hypothetical protein OEM41_04855, partial [Ignavibacteria bacterium]|nr:hypothetical protein [Ignavibacteria bacterium]
ATNRDAENHVGISPVASAERDVLDEQKPPPFLDQGYLYFSRPIGTSATRCSVRISDPRSGMDRSGISTSIIRKWNALH